MDNTVKVKRESKRRIRVEFERAPLMERLKSKFLNMYFLKKVVFLIFKLVLLVGVSFVILFPYISKIFGSFMSPSDFKDVTVILISKAPTIDQYQYIVTENGYLSAVLNTFLISLSVALIQTIICALIAYGLAKFKFKGNNIVFALVILTMMVPRESLRFSMWYFFNNFGHNSVVGGLLVDWGLMEKGFADSLIPLYLLALTGLGFRNGLYIFLLRQFFRGVPDELEESAYVDGSSTFRTFFTIIIPLAIPMLVTVFIFSFAWQWTDDFYTTMFFDLKGSAQALEEEGVFRLKFMSEIVKMPETLGKQPDAKGLDVYSSAVQGTATILIALPLIFAYLFVQKYIVQGIERSGIVG